MLCGGCSGSIATRGELRRSVGGERTGSRRGWKPRRPWRRRGDASSVISLDCDGCGWRGEVLAAEGASGASEPVAGAGGNLGAARAGARKPPRLARRKSASRTRGRPSHTSREGGSRGFGVVMITGVASSATACTARGLAWATLKAPPQTRVPRTSRSSTTTSTFLVFARDRSAALHHLREVDFSIACLGRTPTRVKSRHWRDRRDGRPRGFSRASRANTKNTFIIQNTSPRGSSGRRPPSARPASRLFRLRGGFRLDRRFGDDAPRPPALFGFFRRRVRAPARDDERRRRRARPSNCLGSVEQNATLTSTTIKLARAPPARDSKPSRRPS